MLEHIDTTNYNVIVISPADYFLFTPLLPSVTVGTINGRSIAQPTRQLTRYKAREVQVLEAEATKVDAAKKTVTFEDKSEIHGALGTVTIPYDYLVYSVGSAPQTFGIEGVAKHGCFLKELGDAEKIRNRLMDCVESACITGQSDEEVDRLLHTVVVGGGPTGVEFAAELRDFVKDDLAKWYPEIANRVKVTLVEGLPNILPMFSKKLIEYTEHEFEQQEITLLTKHMLRDLDATHVTVKKPDGQDMKIPYGVFVMAAGNGQRPITRDLMGQFPSVQTERRGISVDDHMRLKGAEDVIFALGDCTATPYAATAQSASQQGKWLGKRFNQMARVTDLKAQLEEAQKNGQTDQVKTLERMVEKAERIKPFHYSHSGALAYIGHDKAIADLPFMNGGVSVGGVATYLAWRGVYFTVSVAGQDVEVRIDPLYAQLTDKTPDLSLPLFPWCRNSSRCATGSTSQWTGPR
jgi:NADH:ubiquinone reductase (non-electrogenic)